MSQVFTMAKVTGHLYNQSHEKFTNEKDSILEAVQNSLLSPFISQRAFTLDEARSMFKESATLALERVQSKDILDEIAQKDEILIIFDTLLVDYAYLNHGIVGDEFKATLSKYDLAWDKQTSTFIQSVVNQLFVLNEQFDQKIENANES